MATANGARIAIVYGAEAGWLAYLFPLPERLYSILIRRPAMHEKIISLTDFKTSASRLLQETRGCRYHSDAERFGECGGAGLCSLPRPAGCFLLLKLMAQGEADTQKNRLTAQGKVFDSLRATLLKQKKQHG